MRLVESAAALLALLLAVSCSSKGSGSSAGCRRDPDCAAGSICQASRCTPGCRASRDCPTGQSCIAGTCTGGGSGGADGGADASAGGAGGTGGAGGGAAASQLGNVCSSDSDCGAGLHCVLATDNDFGLSGPSRGYCTLACNTTSDCSAVFPGSQCNRFLFGGKFCLRGCDPSAADRCFGRYDELCLPFTPADGGAPAHLCYPACATDDDCAGRKCDLSTGLCTDTPKTGAPVGTPCDPTALPSPCAGLCLGDIGGDPTVGQCSAICNVEAAGLAGGCGSDPTPDSPQSAACVYAETYNDGTVVGGCGQLCNCDSDCLAPGMVCESWAQFGVSDPALFAKALKKQGYCIPTAWAADAGVTGLPTCSQDAGVDAQ